MSRFLMPALPALVAALLLALPASALAQFGPQQFGSQQPGPQQPGPQRPDLRLLLRELPRLDLYVDGERVYQGVTATQVGPLVFRAEGPHTVQVVPAGTPPGAGQGFSAGVDTAFPNQSRYVYFLSGSALPGGVALGNELPDPYYALYFHF